MPLDTNVEPDGGVFAEIERSWAMLDFVCIRRSRSRRKDALTGGSASSTSERRICNPPGRVVRDISSHAHLAEPLMRRGGRCHDDDYGSQMVVANYNIMLSRQAALEARCAISRPISVRPKGSAWHAISPGPLARVRHPGFRIRRAARQGQRRKRRRAVSSASTDVGSVATAFPARRGAVDHR